MSLVRLSRIPLAPGGDDLHVGLQRVIAEFEADLIVALAGRAMGDGVGAEAVGDVDLLFRDERAGDGGAEQILALIDRIGAEHREDEVAAEFVAHVLDENVLRLDAQQQRLLARRFKLAPLAEIGGEGDDLAAIFGLQPFQDHRGVETARIGEDDFLGAGGHGRWVPALNCGRLVAFGAAGHNTGRLRHGQGCVREQYGNHRLR
ncbi:MAG: hypothetical protein QM698_11105 [Micropepsaceae bacterium]